jgi:hypothetical protein
MRYQYWPAHQWHVHHVSVVDRRAARRTVWRQRAAASREWCVAYDRAGSEASRDFPRDADGLEF